MPHALTVGQLAQLTGVTAKTIRYYEQVGVLPLPSRSATGYRQYTQSDVHRLLFIRRARALGLSLPSIKALIAELDGGQCVTMRPHLQDLVLEQLRTVRAQIAEFRLLEQQLVQVLERLLTLAPLPSSHAEGCRCLDLDAPATLGTLQRPPLTPLGGEDMSVSNTLESLTLLNTATEEHCGCGCGCGSNDVSLAQLVPPPSQAVQAKEKESNILGK
jgi:MerR family transcriptional regulator, mercuric resistance operon regulatory protein